MIDQRCTRTKGTWQSRRYAALWRCCCMIIETVKTDKIEVVLAYRDIEKRRVGVRGQYEKAALPEALRRCNRRAARWSANRAAQAWSLLSACLGGPQWA